MTAARDALFAAAVAYEAAYCEYRAAYDRWIAEYPAERQVIGPDMIEQLGWKAVANAACGRCNEARERLDVAAIAYARSLRETGQTTEASS